MNKYVKEYCKRGLIFGGFGPIVLGIVLFCIQLSGVKVVLSGGEILLGVASTYVLAFVQAGSSVFNQIEGWPLAKSLGIHFFSLYTVYIACYLCNRWLAFSWEVIAIFTGIFIAVYLAIWLTVYLIAKATSKKLNRYIS
jgi:hypothetical protein